MSQARAKSKPDAGDAADLADTLRTPGYALIAERMHAQRDDYAQQLTTATSWDEVRYLQGQLHSVERSLELPAILRRESKKE
jgi:hypothetical protein